MRLLVFPLIPTGAARQGVVGMSSGEVLVYDPVRGRVRAMLNRDSTNARGKVCSVRWVPHMPFRCAAAFSSGVVMMYDVSLDVKKEEVLPPSTDAAGASFTVEKAKSPKHNPRARWKLGEPGIALYDMSFSPDGTRAALPATWPPRLRFRARATARLARRAGGTRTPSNAVPARTRAPWRPAHSELSSQPCACVVRGGSQGAGWPPFRATASCACTTTRTRRFCLSARATSADCSAWRGAPMRAFC